MHPLCIQVVPASLSLGRLTVIAKAIAKGVLDFHVTVSGISRLGLRKQGAYCPCRFLNIFILKKHHNHVKSYFLLCLLCARNRVKCLYSCLSSLKMEKCRTKKGTSALNLKFSRRKTKTLIVHL